MGKVIQFDKSNIVPIEESIYKNGFKYKVIVEKFSDSTMFLAVRHAYILERKDWCEIHAANKYMYYADAFYFKKSEDATLFALIWA
jgi:hypothetical protein